MLGLAIVESESRDDGERREGEGTREWDLAGLEAMGLIEMCPLFSFPALKIQPFPAITLKALTWNLRQATPPCWQRRPLQIREWGLLDHCPGRGFLPFLMPFLLSVLVFIPDIGLKDRILRTTLLLPIS